MSLAAAPDQKDSQGGLFAPPKWLISKTADLVFLIGGVFVSYALWALWRFGYLDTGNLVLLWVFVFHGPHFWSTLSRTVFDREERQKRGGIYKRSLLWFLVGPVMIGAGLLVTDATGRKELTLLFFFLAALWAYHHVVKQHFGFLALYRAKHGEFDRVGFTVQKWYLIATLWIPMLMVLLGELKWLEQVPGALWWASQGGTNTLLSIGNAAKAYGPWLFGAAQLVFLWSLMRGRAQGHGLNLPLVLLVVASVSLHWVVVTSVLDLPAHERGEGSFGHYALVPLVTIYHNIQYHALIWHYNREKYRGPDAEQRFGLAATLNQNFAIYLACGVLYTAVTIGLEFYDLWPLTEKDLAGVHGKAPIALLAVGLIWGFSFMHYWVDSKIWHVREDDELREILGLGGPKKAAPPSES